MKIIRLYGDMRRRFGKEFRVAIDTPREALTWLCRFQPGFQAYLRERANAPFRVLVGKLAQDEQGLSCPMGQANVIRIVPLVAGAKDEFGQILLGAALLTAGILLAPYTGGTSFAWAATALQGMGVSMMLGGVAQLLAGTPQVDNGAVGGTENQKTWTFSNPTLTTGQGGCVPVLLGEMRIGGHIMSAGIDAHAWVDKGFGGMAPDNAGTRGGNGDTAPWVWAKS